MIFWDLGDRYFVGPIVSKNREDTELLCLQSHDDPDLSIPLENHDPNVINEKLFLANKAIYSEQMTVLRLAFERL